jgi:hypothetical protein
MNVVRNILSVLLSLIFLVSASGFSFTKHTCLVSGNIHVTLGGDFTFASENVEDYCQEKPSCCQGINSAPDSEAESSADCCVKYSRYLITEKDYTAPVKPDMPRTKIRIANGFPTIHIFTDSILKTEHRKHPPPEIFNSRQYLVQHSILLI